MIDAKGSSVRRPPPDISVITPTYNRASLLPRVWASLREQTRTFEWIVVDDGSTDDTEEIIGKLQDSRITYHRFDSNYGVNAARNAGVALAAGRYVIYLDSDDELCPGSMERMVKLMDDADPSVGVVLLSRVQSRRECANTLSGKTTLLLENEMIIRPIRENTAGVFRREVTEDFPLPEDLRGCESLQLFNISRCFRILRVDEPGSIEHRQGDNLSDAESVVARSGDMAIYYERILSRHEEVLQTFPKKTVDYMTRAMYRHAVAGSKARARFLYHRLIRRRITLLALLRATAIITLAHLGASRFEKWRMCYLNRRWTARAMR